MLVAPAGFEQFYKDRAELFKRESSNAPELQKGLAALRNQYIQVIDYTWNIAKECR